MFLSIVCFDVVFYQVFFFFNLFFPTYALWFSLIFTRLHLSCSFVGESMHDDSALVLAYYKEGATDPTFLYFGHALKEVKC
jgi:hypothetical protein